MNKLITYFKQGKGRGLKAMLIFSVLVGLSLWGIIHAVARTIPENAHLNELIDQLPTLVIKDGTVVEPANINRTYFVNGHPLFYLQTDRDEVSPFSEDGIHLTRKMIALISEHQIQRGSFLSGNMTITSITIKEIISSAAIWTPIMAAIFYFALLWLFYFLVLGISALLAWIGS